MRASPAARVTPTTAAPIAFSLNMTLSSNATNTRVSKKYSARGKSLSRPLMPTDHAVAGTRFLGQHRDVLQQVTVRIAEIDRRRRHPCQHDGFVRRLPVEIERVDTR